VSISLTLPLYAGVAGVLGAWKSAKPAENPQI